MEFTEEELGNEEWRDIAGYNGLYKVSSLGRVMSFINKPKLRKQSLNKNGYFHLGLSNNGCVKNKETHQLVAMAFLGHVPCGMKLVVDHIDHNPLNNRVTNLNIITQRENTNKKHLHSSSKYTGVTVSRGTIKSKIVVGNKSLHLGVFDTEEEASMYYESALVCINEGRPEDIITKRVQYTSNCKGVCWSESKGVWIARININNKRVHLGGFDTEEDAVKYLYKCNELLNSGREADISPYKKPHSSKYKGVYWAKREEKWQAYKTINGKSKFMGYFKNEEDAYNSTL